MKKKIILSAAFIAISFTTFAQVAVGTTSPVASAALDVTSTTQGFLPPRMTQVQMNAIAAPAEGLMVYCLDCIPKGIYVNTGDGSSGSNGSSEFVNMITGESSGTDTTTAVVELISTTGRIWMDRNLGATQAATAYDDTAAYGDLYQWGRAKDGHQSRTSNITNATATTGDPGHGNFILTATSEDFKWTHFTDDDALWQDGLNDPCPTGYRVPTATEFQAELDNFTSNDADGAFEALKLPRTGYRSYANGDIYLLLGGGYYYSSTVNGRDIRSVGIDGVAAYINNNSRGNALAIRCIKKVINESTTDVIEVISTTGNVWMDRNLGATQVATSRTDTAAYGDLYQWGRAKDGHESRVSSTTTTTVTSANAGHGNFIIADTTTDTNWTDFAGEDVLWQDGLNDPCPTGYRIPTISEFQEEQNEFTSNDYTGAFSSVLKLTSAGYRKYADGEIINTSSYYWSSTVNSSDSNSFAFIAIGHTANIDGFSRAAGLPVRCIKE